MDFLKQWSHKGKSEMWYDWMVRDYLQYLINQKDTYIFAPGTYELMNLGDKWLSKATSEIERARKACEYEGKNQEGHAGDEWQKIFGSDMPRMPK